MNELQSSKTSTGIQQNLAGLLCYVAWWVTGIVFLVLEKDNKFIRFHAVQSIVAFGAVTVVEIILALIPFVGWVLSWIVSIAAFILWLLLMYRAYQGKTWKLPVAGNIAEKQLKA